MIEEEYEPVEAYEIDDDDHDEDDDDICPDCNGSGEGMYDGTTCTTCHGH